MSNLNSLQWLGGTQHLKFTQQLMGPNPKEYRQCSDSHKFRPNHNQLPLRRLSNDFSTWATIKMNNTTSWTGLPTIRHASNKKLPLHMTSYLVHQKPHYKLLSIYLIDWNPTKRSQSFQPTLPSMTSHRRNDIPLRSWWQIHIHSTFLYMWCHIIPITFLVWLSLEGVLFL